MRYSIYLLLSVAFVTCLNVGVAQAEGNLVYNSTTSANKGSTTLYNSGSGPLSGPIPLKSMIRGATVNARQSAISGAKARPYNFGSGGTSNTGSLTPSQVRARQATEDERYEAYKKKQAKYDVSRRAQEIAERRRNSNNQVSPYANRFNTSEKVGIEEARTVPKRKARPAFVDQSKIITPTKVFNSN